MASGAPPPLVSIIVPAHNAEATLRDAVQSALRGDYASFELIIVDDGSTDSTAAIAAEIAAEDSRVRVCRRLKGGVSAALNSGLAPASGDYVARLDADDLWHPSKLSKQVELACSRPEAAFLYCFVRYIDGAGRVLFDAEQQRFPERAFARGFYESLIGGNSSALIKRSAIAEADGYDERLASWEDWLLQLRITARHPVAFVPEYLVGYRARPGSLSADPANMLQSWRAARRIAAEPFPHIPDEVQRWAHGKRCALLAESFAWRGRYGTAAALMGEAFRNDWRWTSSFLRFRAGRSLRNRFANRPPTLAGPLFADCDPAAAAAPTRSEAGAIGGGLRRLEEQRRRILEAIDRDLAQQSPSR